MRRSTTKRVTSGNQRIHAVDQLEPLRMLATFSGTSGNDTIGISSPTGSFTIVTLNAADGARANQGALP